MNKTILYIFILILATCSIHVTKAQQFAFKHLTTDDGLSHSTVTSILQDKKGFMWFGTLNGLNRYDGYKFTIYEGCNSDGKPTSNYRINALFQDSKNRIWLATSGLCYFDTEKEKIFRFSSNNNVSELLRTEDINTIYLSSKNILWIGTSKGLVKLPLTDSVLSKPVYQIYTHNDIDTNSINSNVIQSIFEDSKGNIWIGLSGTNTFVDRLIDNNGHFQHFGYKNYKDVSVFSICEDRFHNIWFGTWGHGAFKLSPDKMQFEQFVYDNSNPFSLGSNIVFSLFLDKEKTLWLGTRGGGLNKYNPEKNTFTRITSDAINKWSLNHDYIQSIYQDRNGLLWLGTGGNGLNYTEGVEKKFKSRDIKSLYSKGLKGYNVNSMAGAKNGDIYIGSLDGYLNIFNIQKNTIKCLYLNPGFSISSILFDRAGNLYVASDGNGLCFFDKTAVSSGSYAFTRYIRTGDVSQKSLSNNYIYDMAEDLSGNIWIGTWGGGLSKFNKQTKTFVHYAKNTENQKGLNTDIICSIFPSSTGTLWLGSADGLYSFIPDNNSDTIIIKDYFRHDPANPNSLPNDFILSIFEDSKKNLWLSGQSGICKLNFNQENLPQFTTYTTKDGLRNNTIVGILEDKNGTIWASSENGISKFDARKKAFKSYDSNDGLHNNVFHKNCSFIDSNGQLFFGGSSGFSYFLPNEIKDNKFLPELVLTDFKVFNIPVNIGDTINRHVILKKSITETDTIELSYKESVFSIEFAGLHFSDPAKNHYAYKMEGFDKTWQYVDANRRFATYTNLPSGEYIFKVKASNNEQLWNPISKNLVIIISPPWWHTWWAYILYFIIFITLLFFFRRYIILLNSIKHKLLLDEIEKQKTEELNNAKLMFFTNISHEFRTPLTLILGPTEQLLDMHSEDIPTKKNLQLIQRNAQRLLQLINQLLDFRKAETETMELSVQKNDIIQQIKQIKQAFDNFAIEKNIEFKFYTPVQEYQMWFDPDKLDKVLFNLLSNAFKFTEPNGTISISISLIASNKELDNSCIEITVSDTGIGIPPDAADKIFDRFYQVNDSRTRGSKTLPKGSGIGLALVKKLVELQKGTITVVSEIGKGSHFTIHLPVDILKDSSLKVDEISTLHATPPISNFNLNEVIAVNQKQNTDKNRNNKKQLLIVEDDNDICAFLSQLFAEDFSVTATKNGQEAYQKCLENMPELVISDVMMPVMDGYELCAKIKSNILTCHIPVILLTAKAAIESQITGLKTGADDYIAKPFNPLVLQLKVKNILETRLKLRQKFNDNIDVESKDVTQNPLDEEFLNKVIKTVEDNIADENFDVEKFSLALAMSRSNLHHKLKALTDLAPSDFIRIQRLKKAAKLLKEGRMNVTEVFYQTGFSNHSYFSKCFKSYFGLSPSDFIEGSKK